MRAYDYIIIGAGSAGCVLASRLSEDRDATVLVLEAGPMDHDRFIHLPAGVHRAWKDRRFNWNYSSEPQAHMARRRIPIPRGRVVGGSSSINSMVYMRGHPLDYDRWAEEFDLPGWDYARCLPYFRKCESWSEGGNPWRGGAGPLGVTRGRMQNPLFEAFLEAGEQSGVGTSGDLNGFKPEGLARTDSTIRNGLRCSAAVAHLKPALSRSNLALKTGALVSGLIMSGNRATGVRFVENGQALEVHAEREVLLCGGAINSPHVLMLSGIGPAGHLEAHGIKPVIDLPGVGRNLQDHLDVQLQFKCREAITWERIANPLRQVAAGLRWLADGSGIVASNIWEAGGLVRSNSETPYPNLQYHFAPVGVDYDGDRIILLPAFQFHLSQLRQESRGYIELASADPAAAPLLHFDFLATERDNREFVEGVRLTREIAAQPAFGRFRDGELKPGREVTSDAAIRDWVAANAETEFHPSCTCRMGGDRMAVVDGELKVHGVEGLRVVDASVMPNVISANLNAPTQMIAERAADFIRSQPQLAPERPGFHFEP